MGEVFLAKAMDVSNGARLIVQAEKHEIALYRIDGTLRAYANLCPHQGGPACEGVLIHKVEEVLDEQKRFLQMKFDESELHIVCPWHGWEFRMDDGICVANKNYQLRAFALIERAGDVFAVID
jgi:nitrite reductase (NADH) small subunit